MCRQPSELACMASAVQCMSKQGMSGQDMAVQGRVGQLRTGCESPRPLASALCVIDPSRPVLRAAAAARMEPLLSWGAALLIGAAATPPASSLSVVLPEGGVCVVCASPLCTPPPPPPLLAIIDLPSLLVGGVSVHTPTSVAVVTLDSTYTG